MLEAKGGGAWAPPAALHGWTFMSPPQTGVTSLIFPCNFFLNWEELERHLQSTHTCSPVGLMFLEEHKISLREETWVWMVVFRASLEDGVLVLILALCARLIYDAMNGASPLHKSCLYLALGVISSQRGWVQTGAPGSRKRLWWIVTGASSGSGPLFVFPVLRTPVWWQRDGWTEVIGL